LGEFGEAAKGRPGIARSPTIGGLYRTTDRGAHWTRINALDRVTLFTFNPTDANEAYLTTEVEGLWHTAAIHAVTPVFPQVANYPFRRPERVFYNPHNLAELWVTSFGHGMMVGAAADPMAGFALRIEPRLGQPGQMNLIFGPILANTTYIPDVDRRSCHRVLAMLTTSTQSDTGNQRTVTDAARHRATEILPDPDNATVRRTSPATAPEWAAPCPGHLLPPVGYGILNGAEVVVRDSRRRHASAHAGLVMPKGSAGTQPSACGATGIVWPEAAALLLARLFGRGSQNGLDLLVELRLQVGGSLFALAQFILEHGHAR